MPLLGPLLLGPRRWREASTLDEWRARPTLSHVFRHRFLRDPPWACLPRPGLEVLEERVEATVLKEEADFERAMYAAETGRWQAPPPPAPPTVKGPS